ncbi:sulfite exporter TauE/SafE family protein [Halobacteriovorax sp. HFRX-2_2]|uniref:sulfite exporter TauE/SafE family protein n=1 Tax=unclassified Halobacteriovorax TaxID=2639665 RepID=UPI00371F3754
MDQLSSLQGISPYVIISAGLTMGLVANFHCVGMCGGITMAVSKSFSQNMSYQVGRLLGYMATALVIPVLGFTILDIKSNPYLMLFSGLSIGLILIWMGLKRLFKFSNFKFAQTVSQKLHNLNAKLWPKISKKVGNKPHLFNFSIGSISVLLPCGLLWAMLALAISAASPALAALFVFFFWLGTLPGLLFGPSAIRKIKFPSRIQAGVPYLFLIIGTATIVYRVYMMWSPAPGAPTCH